MSRPNRDELLGYLLGALDSEQHEQIADEIEQDHELRAEIRKLEACVGRLGLADKADHFEPPANLAARTCQLVAAERRPALIMRPAKDQPRGSRRTSWTDMIVAACALVTGAAMLFPAILHSRNQAQIAACQNNLRYAGFGFQDYSTLQPDGSFPAPEPTGNRAAAGVYAVHLLDGQLVPSRSIFLCPSAQSQRQTTDYRPPTLTELDRATGAMLATAHRMMGGDYGANLGYTQDGKLQRPCNARRASYPLLADAPSDAQQRRGSANHGGRGQNVLYEDGHVQFIVIYPSVELPDDPFHNRRGIVAAGVDCEDCCLGCSQDPPMPAVLLP